MSELARSMKRVSPPGGYRSHLEAADLLHLRATVRSLTTAPVAETTGQWLRAVLRHVRSLTGFDKGALFVWAPDREPVGYGDGVAPDALTAYIERFAAVDEARRRALHSGMEVWNQPQMWPREQLERSEYWRAFAVPFRLHDAVGALIRLPAQQGEIQLALYQDLPATAKLIEERQGLIEVILPAFRIAAQAHLASDNPPAPIGSVMDVTGQALMLFGINARELRTNPVMRRILLQDPEREMLLSSLKKVAAAVVASLQREQAGRNDKRPEGTRREVATSMAAYRLRGNPVGHNSMGQASAVLVSLDRVAFEIPASDSLRARYGLTVRELQVASLIMHRLSNTEIARMLSISPHTARHHTENVLAKLGVRSRKALRRLVTGGGPEQGD